MVVAARRTVVPMTDARPAWIAGRPVTGETTVEVTNPYDGSVVGAHGVPTAAQVEEAVAAAWDVRHRFAATPVAVRAEALMHVSRRITERLDEIAELITAENGKPLMWARAEAGRAASVFRFAAEEARRTGGDVQRLDTDAASAGRAAIVRRFPYGPVLGIAPFNFPLNLVAHKLGPAIAAGCPVVLKPASQTPFSSILLARLLLEECGLPAGYLHVVTGSGSVVGNALVDHDDVALITFTGSPDVGWGIRARAPRKRVGLELGNNAPLILEADGDWRSAVAKVKVAGFSHAGQSCISTQRLLVHRSIKDEVVAELTAAVGTLVVGDPLDEATDVSALISTSERDRVAEWVDEARAEGATIAAGGEIGADGVLAPTLVVDATPEMKVCALEVFGPVVAVTAYDDFDEALAIANDTRYGLQAGVFTADVTKALKAARTLDFGGVLINEVPTWRADQQPYGGLRDSGNTREGPAWSVREMTEERLIILTG